MKQQKGFTLIELLVVIAIIGILASIVLASLNSARQKGRDAKRISDLKQIQLALELYYDANQGYPTNAQAMASSSVLVSGGYIAALPTDPSTNGYYSYAGLASDGSTACSSGPCAKYVLGGDLEVANNSVLASDVDTNPIGGVNCTDPKYCVTP